MSKELDLTHIDGDISIHNMHIHGQKAGMKRGLLKDDAPVLPDTINVKFQGQLGIQIHHDGRVWICIDSVAFLRFEPDRTKGQPVWEIVDAQGRI